MGANESKSCADGGCDCCSECAAAHAVPFPLIPDAHLPGDCGPSPACSEQHRGQSLTLETEPDLLRETSDQGDGKARLTNLEEDKTNPEDHVKPREKKCPRKKSKPAARSRLKEKLPSCKRSNILFFCKVPPTGESVNSPDVKKLKKVSWPFYMKRTKTPKQWKFRVEESFVSNHSAILEHNYPEFLPHNCSACCTENDMISLFEFQKLEEKCNAMCGHEEPPEITDVTELFEDTPKLE